MPLQTKLTTWFTEAEDAGGNSHEAWPAGRTEEFPDVAAQQCSELLLQLQSVASPGIHLMPRVTRQI